MTPEDVEEFRDAQPFVPFRICLTDGKYYDVPRRSFLMIARHIISVGLTNNPGSGICDQIGISPLHIVRIENLQAA